MKIKIYVLLILFIFGCVEPYENEVPKLEVKNELKIDTNVGIRLETPFVENDVKMNVKTELQGKYFIFITDISDKVVSKEEIILRKGDNVLDIHTRILPTSGYRIGLYSKTGQQLAITDFNKR
jgi:hypothetical protein